MNRETLACCAAFAIAWALSPGARATDVQFVEVGAVRGLQPYTMTTGLGGGVAAADFDDDGDVDLFVPTAEGLPDQLYRNSGDGQFEEIAAAAGVGSLDRGRVALWFDYDGDRRLDLFVSSDCAGPAHPECPDRLSIKLYRQVADAQFQDVTAAAGFLDDAVEDGFPHRGGSCAGDVDGDGDLDLIFGMWHGEARLFLNQGDGSFVENTAGSGIGIWDDYWQCVMHDFDGDGRLDIYQAVDFAPNRLWVNQTDGTFVDEAPASGSDNAWNDMGVTLGDYDNDGDLDIYVTNIKTTNPPQANVLYRNDTAGGVLQFTDVAPATGVDHGYWGWGATFFDADNDTRLDLAETNGYVAGLPWTVDPSKFFLNHGGDPVTFADVSNASGFNDTLWGSALIALDYDRDGDLDLAQTCNGWGPQPHALRLLENELGGVSAENRYLVVKPRMVGSNHRAIGAVVRVRIGTLELMRPITAGTSFFGQEPAEAFFGLGTAASVDEVMIEWPDGTVSVQPDVASDGVVTIGNTLALSIEGDELAWFHPDMGPALTYDVVRGDLGVLRATGGEFSQATTACLAEDQSASVLPGLPDPDPGQGLWFLVRVGSGSYDDPWGAQAGSRDAGIAAAPRACHNRGLPLRTEAVRGRFDGEPSTEDD